MASTMLQLTNGLICWLIKYGSVSRCFLRCQAHCYIKNTHSPYDMFNLYIFIPCRVNITISTQFVNSANQAQFTQRVSVWNINFLLFFYLLHMQFKQPLGKMFLPQALSFSSWRGNKRNQLQTFGVVFFYIPTLS